MPSDSARRCDPRSATAPRRPGRCPPPPPHCPTFDKQCQTAAAGHGEMSRAHHQRDLWRQSPPEPPLNWPSTDPVLERYAPSACSSLLRHVDVDVVENTLLVPQRHYTAGVG